MCDQAPLAEVEHLKLHFPVRTWILIDREVARVQAVDDVTVALEEGQTLGLVGGRAAARPRSRALMRLIDSTEGRSASG